MPTGTQIPMEIVRIFEKHGFIWGGRWHHYDTMHFEYRPELAGAISEALSDAGPLRGTVQAVICAQPAAKPP